MASDNPFKDPSLIDVPVPKGLIGKAPVDKKTELEVNAWGPFNVDLEDADEIPAYLGSRLRFEWNGRAIMARFWPAEPISDKMYTVTSAVTWISDAIVFQTVEHGRCVISPVPKDQLKEASLMTGLTKS